MELTLIRHGENEGIIDNVRVHLGWGDFSLTERGRDQARNTHERLKNEKYDRIISSDVKRAVETASIIFPGKPVEYSPLLRELGCGQLSGCTAAKAGEIFGRQYSENPDRFDFTPFGGEHVKDMEQRARTFIKQFEEPDNESKIAVVTHGGPIRAISAYILGLDWITLGGRLIFNYCSITAVKFSKVGWQILCTNDTAHLMHDGLI